MHDALPFSGLGFDLQPVLVKAARMMRRPVLQSQPAPPTWETPFFSGGYERLVWLGREIRGQ